MRPRIAGSRSSRIVRAAATAAFLAVLGTSCEPASDDRLIFAAGRNGIRVPDVEQVLRSPSYAGADGAGSFAAGDAASFTALVPSSAEPSAAVPDQTDPSAVPIPGEGDDDLLDLPPLPDVDLCDPTDVIDTGLVPYPYAPQCVAPFSGADAGATARGVTGDSIRVAVYVTSDPTIQAAARYANGCGTPECVQRYASTYTEWFERTYETYGRDVELVFHEGGGAESNRGIALQDARDIAALDPPVFAVIGGPYESGAVFAEELARAGVMCFCTASLPEEFYARTAPYVYTWLPSSTQAYLHRAEYILDRLAGRRALYAGDPSLRSRQRRFGLVWFDTPAGDYEAGVDFFERRLGEQGVRLAAKVRYENIEGCQVNAAGIVAQLQLERVTSVIFAGDPLCPIPLTAAAQAQGVRWEWIVTGSLFTDTNGFARLYEQRQWARAFGVSMQPVDVRDENDYWYRMYRSVDPSGTVKEDARTVLASLGLFFTGVHLTGPTLTPERFHSAMAMARTAGGTPTVPRVSFGPKVIDGVPIYDVAATDDMAEIWWDPDAVDANGNRGAYRYAERGARYVWGTWPNAAPRLFVNRLGVVSFDVAPDQ